jgi:hypothetical protein
MTKNEKMIEKQESIERLKALLKDNDTIYTSVQKVSASGMYRHIKVIAIKDNEPHWLSYSVAHALEYPYKNDTSAVGVSGCGMDMGWALVNNLGHELGLNLKQRWL